MKKCLRGRERFRETDTKRDEPNGLNNKGYWGQTKRFSWSKYTDWKELHDMLYREDRYGDWWNTEH